MSDYGPDVMPEHAQLLRAAAITPQVASAAGIRSAEKVTDLPEEFRSLGVAAVPALVFPWHRLDGGDPVHQIRPDTPIVRKDGMSAKYLFSFGTGPVLAVHPSMRGRVADASAPILVVEGTKQYLAAVSALAGEPYAAVGIAGCYGWSSGGKPIADLARVPWSRDVYACFDADVESNRGVWEAASAFNEVLTTFGASTMRYIKVPGVGTAGLDDVLGTVTDPASVMKRIIDRARDKLPRRPAAKRPKSKSASDPSAVHAHVHTPGSPAETADEPAHGPGRCACTPPALAYSENILDRLAADARALGLAGEAGNAKLIYLSVASQILDDPVSVAMKGLSSVGKSFTTQTVIRFFPEDAVIILTGMSERALVYMERDFSHRTVVLYEAVALREGREKNEGNQTAYYIRSLMSEGCIRYVVTVKDEGGNLVGKEISKAGPTNFVITTTSASLHNENETRMLSLPADDSKEQTRRIFKAIAAGKRRERDLGDWHAYYQWVRTCAEHRVAIPYADHLADNMATDSVRLRRDFTVLLQLIEANAILHQQSRARDDQGCIIATACDYLTVRNLIADLISTAVGASVPRTVRQTVEAVSQLSQEGHQDVTVKMLAEHLGIERSVAQRRLTTARQRGYVVNQEDSQGKPARYRTGDALPGDHAVLPETLPPQHVCTHQDSHPVIPQVNEGCAGVHAQRGDKSAEVDELWPAEDAGASIPEPPEDDSWTHDDADRGPWRTAPPEPPADDTADDPPVRSGPRPTPLRPQLRPVGDTSDAGAAAGDPQASEPADAAGFYSADEGEWSA